MLERTLEELKEADDESIETELANRVYKAGIFFERLEHAQRVWGNGHHMAQNLAREAVKMYRERKRDQDPT